MKAEVDPLKCLPSLVWMVPLWLYVPGAGASDNLPKAESRFALETKPPPRPFFE